VDGREAWKVLFRLPNMIRAPLGRRIRTGVGQAEGRDRGGGDHLCRSTDVESSIGCDGRMRGDVPPSEPFGPDNIPGAAADVICDVL